MNSKWKTIAFIALLAIGIPFLVLAVQETELFSPKASSLVPQNITISNLTDSSFTVSWTTPEGDTLTNLAWGDSIILGNVEVDVLDKETNSSDPRGIHSVNIKNLSPETQYYFRITSGSVQYPNAQESPYSIKTLSSPTNEKISSFSVYGDVDTESEALVFIYPESNRSFSSSIPAQTVTSNGTWYIELSDVRGSNNDYLDMRNESFLIVAYTANKAFSQVYNSSDSPKSLSLTSEMSEEFVRSALAQGALPVTTSTPTPTTTASSGSIPLIGSGETPSPTSFPLDGSQSTPNNLPSKEDVMSSLISPAVSNVTDSSLSISYISYSKTKDVMLYGEESDPLTFSKLDDRDSGNTTWRYFHHFTLTNLTPNKQFYFKSQEENILRTFTLPSRISFPSGETIVSGVLKSTAGECFVRSQVVRDSLMSSPVTTIPTANTSWSVNIAPVRTSNLETFMVPIASDTLINNAFCMKDDGDILFGAYVGTVQDAVTSGINIQMYELN